MRRSSLTRVLALVPLLAIPLVLAAPAAQAGPLFGPQERSIGWFDFGWLQELGSAVIELVEKGRGYIDGDGVTAPAPPADPTAPMEALTPESPPAT